MSDDLYQKAIIDLAKRSRTQPRLDRPDLSAVVDNPLCGDRITLDLALDGEKIREVGHKTRGCLLCEAAACLIVDHAPGAASDELQERADTLVRSFRDEETAPGDLWPGLDILAPARRYKSRLDCVTLPFQALIRAIKSKD
ncbi:MAG: iron-sulfur cluster assembly scaffold protein [Pseudomonadota bacterium]